MTFRKDIEGLRGVAVLLVVLYHSGVDFFSGGYVGVDVFFVLSGYLITAILYKEFEETGRIAFARFYGRRARRLLPAVSVMLVVVVAAALVLYGPLDQIMVVKSSIATSLYLSNVLFARRATDYLGGDAELDPLLHTWSLSVEEQFYIMWPLAVAFALYVGHRRGSSWKALAWVMGAVSVLSLVGAIWLTETRQPWAFFMPMTRAWEFAIGALAWQLTPARASRRVGVAAWGGLAAILLASIVYDSGTLFPGVAALLPVLGTAAVLVARGAFGIDRVLGAAPMQFAGRLSYGWYLWHWPLIVFVAAEWPDASVGMLLVASAVGLGIAVLSYRYIEVPIRYAAPLKGYPWRSIGVGAALSTVALICSATAWSVSRSVIDEDGPQARYAAAHEQKPWLYNDECRSTFFESAPTACEGGAEGGTKTVVLFGDSHAAQWQPALEKEGLARGWRIVTIVKDACAPSDIPAFVHPKVGGLFTDCTVWRDRAVAAIVNMAPDAVLVASTSSYPERTGATLQSWREATARTLEALSASGATVVELTDNPLPKFEVPKCLGRADWRGQPPSSCSFPREGHVYSDVAAAERRAARDAGAATIDPTPAICEGSICTVVDGDTVIYRDEGHLSVQYVLSRSGRLARELEAAMADVGGSGA